MLLQLNLGSAPYGEDCAQVNDPDYRDQAHKECQAFIDQLKRIGTAGGKPGTNLFRIVPFRHDFGTYFEVCCHCETDDDVRDAMWFEERIPELWDDEARLKLGLPDDES